MGRRAERLRLQDHAGRKTRLLSLLSRIVARVEAGSEGTDTRFIVTNLGHGSGRSLYQDLYCRRGQAENYIKAWNSRLRLHVMCSCFVLLNAFGQQPTARRNARSMAPSETPTASAIALGGVCGRRPLGGEATMNCRLGRSDLAVELLDFEPLIAELRWGSEAIYGVATGGRQSEIEPMRCCTS